MTKWLGRIALAVLAFLSAALGIFAGIQNKRAKEAGAEVQARKDTLAGIKEKTGRLEKAALEHAKAKEESDEEKKNLSDTPDAGLVDRANKLF